MFPRKSHSSEPICGQANNPRHLCRAQEKTQRESGPGEPSSQMGLIKAHSNFPETRDFEENVRITRTVCDVAHALNIGCEGEIGKIGGTEDDITVDEADAMITTVEEALDFSTRTTVDYLAVSIGTAHGVYKTTPKLNFERLVEIKNAVQKPIVLHGGSGVPDDQVVEAIACGVAKINVDTELRQSFTKGVQAYWATNPNDFVLADSLGAGVQTMKETVQQKIRLFGASGKA